MNSCIQHTLIDEIEKGEEEEMMMMTTTGI
jgi:hypothetical protein